MEICQLSVKVKYFEHKGKIHTIPNPSNCAVSYTGLQNTFDSPPAGVEKCKECFETPFATSFANWDDMGKAPKRWSMP